MTDYGTDTSCTDSLKPGRLVSGARLVAEAAYRRLTTPRGTLRGGEDEANYGLDLADLLGTNAGADDAAALPERVRGELMKDGRVLSVDTTVAATQDGPAVSWTVTTIVRTDSGPFTLVLAVADLTVQLLGITT